MPIYEFGQTGISRLDGTTFSAVGLRERDDLQRLLREHVEVIAPDTLVIAEEFGEWADSRRRIDLLAIDKAANLVVIELKRTEDGGHMDLQSVRYASMVSTMTLDKAIDAFGRYLKSIGKDAQSPRETILDFLGWAESDDGSFAPDVRIVLASAEFSKELTSSVLWLFSHGVDIRCVRLKPYSLDNRILVDVQQIIPLPEAVDYQVQVRDKARKEQEIRTSNADFTRFNVHIGDEVRTSMWKRNAIFLICKYLCDHGINPEEIAEHFSWRPSLVWYSVDGMMDSPGFAKSAAEKAAAGGPLYNAARWYRGENELVHANGKTYAFSNQWGGETWHNAMGLLKENYPQFRIDFFAAT